MFVIGLDTIEEYTSQYVATGFKEYMECANYFLNDKWREILQSIAGGTASIRTVYNIA